MSKWWNWWTKWWVWSAAIIFLILLFSRPPQLWFWLTLFVVILLYGFERSIQ